MLTKHHRAKLIRRHLGLSQAQFAELFGKTQAWTSRTEHSDPEKFLEYPDHVLEKLNREHGINPEWYLTEKGEMIIKNFVKPRLNDVIDLTDNNNSRARGENLRILPITITEHGRENISLVTTQVAAGYLEHLENPEFFLNLPSFYLPMPEFQNGTFRCFPIAGESMAPEVQPNSYVIGKYVDNWINNFSDERVHIVVHYGEKRPVLKRVKNRIKELGRLALMSDNIGYDTYTVPVEDVKEMWQFVCVLKFGINRTGQQITSKLSEMESQIAFLTEFIKKQLGLDPDEPLRLN